MPRQLTSLFRVLFLLSVALMAAGIAATFIEIRAVSTDHEKREGVVSMLEIIFAGGTLCFAFWMLSKYFERKLNSK